MARWQTKNKDGETIVAGIVKRIVVTCDLRLLTVGQFGNGDSDGTEMKVLLDEAERRPVLTGATIAGALRSYTLKRELGYGVTDRAKRTMAREDAQKLTVSRTARLFGRVFNEDTGAHSRIIVDDALGTLPDGVNGIQTRAGVKIDPSSRTAEKGQLYSAQVWSEGTVFKARFELVISIHDADHAQELEDTFWTALSGLETGEILFGGRKSRGYGQIEAKNWRYKSFEMETAAGLRDWLRLHPDTEAEALESFEMKHVETDFPDERRFVRIAALFRLEGSLLIRAGSDTADMAHLTNAAGEPILSGTALAGALRARAETILNSLGGNPDKRQQLLNSLFGAHGDDDSDERRASRLFVRESVIDNASMERIQNRVKLDRFTGGAYETGLFEQQPVFATDKTNLHIGLSLRLPSSKSGDEHDQPFENAHIALVLLMLRDLWTADLALGGEQSVGRGRLRGKSATLTFNGIDQAKPLDVIQLNETGLESTPAEGAQRFNAMVDDMIRYIGS